MKRVIVALLILGLGIGCLIAQSNATEIRKQIQLELEKELEGVPGSPKMTVKFNQNMDSLSSAPDAAYFGIFVEDLTFPKAQELNYKGNIGVLITGVVANSPAWNARLQEDDIILSIGDKEVTNQLMFDKIRKQYRAGDVTVLGVYRAGETLKVDFTFGSRETKVPMQGDVQQTKKKKSAGYGGGTWVPMWFMPELADINTFIKGMSFAEMDDNGILMQGIAGKGHIGKGVFIGGAFYSYEDETKKQDPEDGSYHLWLRYENTMGGVTLDKRIPLSKSIIASAGLMLGAGGHTIEVLKNNSSYNWADWDSTAMDSNNTHTVVKRGYLIVQPRAEVMVRLLSWLGIRAEGGYTYGYAPKKGWRVKGINDENFEVANSPNTNYQGFQVTIGPWFGF